MKGDVLIEQLNQKIIELESELKEYKRCAVLGGDGKPIWHRKTIYWRDIEFGVELMSGEVYSISAKDENDTHFTDEFIVSAGDSWELNQSECYSTPDAVPGGDT